MSPHSLTVVLLVAVAGCGSNAPKVETVVEIPEAYGTQPIRGKPLQRWCSDFGDAQLETLVTSAFEDNLDLKAAWARLRQADAVSASTNSNLYPSVDLSGGGSQRNTFQPGFGAIDIGLYNGSAAASYEIDLWGKLYMQRQAARYDARAARTDVESLAVTLTSQVADAYFDAVYRRQKLALFDEQVDVNKQYLELTRLRLTQGQAAALDVNQQQQQIESLLGQRVLSKVQLDNAAKRLAVLVGQAPSKDLSGALAELPELPELPAIGLPADLVQQRPDLRSAQLRLEAADRRVTAAVRDLLPTLRISADLTLQAMTLGELFDTLFYSVAGSASQPLFDGGRRFAEIDRSKAVVDERLYSFAQTLLTAIQEVEQAIVLETGQQTFLEKLEAQRKHANLALELSRDRYRSGGDYLRVLTALQSLQQIEQSLLDARRQQLGYRVQLCRALGGSWTTKLQAPPSREDEAKNKKAHATGDK